VSVQIVDHLLRALDRRALCCRAQTARPHASPAPAAPLIIVALTPNSTDSSARVSRKLRSFLDI
jgi:hypothetical protein